MGKKSFYVLLGLGGWLSVCLATVHPVSAFYLDDAGTLFVSGLFYNQARIRTVEPKGNNTKVGDWTLMQHRTFLDPQLLANVLPWVQNQPWGADFLEAFYINDVRFFFNPRFEFEQVYDWGPDAFRDDLPPRLQKTNRIRLHEIYGAAELFDSRLSIKVGRQNLSWGETDSFRLLDRINPLDNRFGSNLVPLDERRLPLMMVRVTLGLPDLPGWDIYNTALEGFIAPDKSLPAGSPGATPLGVRGGPFPTPENAPTLFANLDAIGLPLAGSQLDRPDISLGDSRMGIRLLWTWRDASFSIAHLSTYEPRTIALRLNDQGQPVLKNLSPNIQVTGATVSYPIPGTYTVVRSEVAGFFGEPFFIEEKNFSLGEPVPKRNTVQGVVGIDHNQWIRALNSQSTFSVTGQLFYTNIQGSMRGIKTPLARFSSDGQFRKFTDVDRESFVNTLSVSTDYLGVPFYFFSSQVTPSVAWQYDWEGAWLIQPRLTFITDPFRFRIEYNWIEGRFIGLGGFRDKDHLAFRIDYVLG